MKKGCKASFAFKESSEILLGYLGSFRSAAILSLVLSSFLTTGISLADYRGAMDALNRGDYSAALDELEPLAETGDPRAQNALGYLYRRGLGVSRDEVRARYWEGRAMRGLVGSSGQERAKRPPAKSAGGRVVGAGSGVIVDRVGSVLTNHHVVAGCAGVRVRSGGDAGMARVQGADPGSDLALLRLEQPFKREPVRLRPSMEAVLGEEVLVAGFPLQGLLAPEVHVEVGIVSALAGPRGDRRLIQISSPVQPGSSGGPVLDAGGRLIGIVAGVLRPADANRVGAIWPAGISFAVRPKRVAEFLRLAGVSVRTSKSAARDASARAAAAQGFTLLVECIR
jgi:S1-C subfamily serine protease